MRHHTLSASLLLVVGIAGCSTLPAQRAADVSAHSGVVAAQPLVKPGDFNCLRSTGSWIAPRQGECLPVTGHSYSREDLRRTGAPGLAQALQLLDPGISVRSH